MRTKVADLRIADPDPNRGERELLPDEREKVVKTLLGATERPLTWSEVACEVLGLPDETRLTIPEEIGTLTGYSNRAPRDETTAAIEKFFASDGKGLVSIRRWWDQANREQRSILVLLLTGEDEEDLGAYEHLVNKIPQHELEELATVSLPSGRAAYSRSTLRMINEALVNPELDLFQAVRKCFPGIPDDWQPPSPGLDEPTGQPTVDRNIVAVRKFLSSATMAFGCPPSRIVVELAREGAHSPAKAEEERKERERRRRWNEKLRAELTTQKKDPTPANVRRYSLLLLYGNECLYCGNKIGFDTSELDHIVPRADGGANVLHNLAAVCSGCNTTKGTQPFGVLALNGKFKLDEAVKRVETLRYTKEEERWASEDELKAYKKRVIARLGRTTMDREQDRSIASTSYAATALVGRLREFMKEQWKKEPWKKQWKDSQGKPEQSVWVFAGGVTAEARRVLGIKIPELLGRPLRAGKRLDRRHHAIDALVLTTLRPGVATLLGKRIVEFSRQKFTHPGSEVDLSAWTTKTNDSEIFGSWQDDVGPAICGLIEDAVEKDRLVVLRPLRLRPSGQLHAEQPQTVNKHKLGDAWEAEDIRCIIDLEVFEALSRLASAHNGTLQEDDERSLVLGTRQLGPDTKVNLFPLNHAMMRVSSGTADLGHIHHARLYAWKDNRGAYKFGFLRVFRGDLAQLFAPKKNACRGVDVFEVEIPFSSQSWRHANPKLVAAVKSGQARYLGWLVPGDELEIDFGVSPNSTDTTCEESESREDGPEKTTQIATFLKRFPEKRWYIKSFEGPDRMVLGPSYLAEEGWKILRAAEQKLASTSEGEAVGNIMSRGWEPRVNGVFGNPSVTVTVIRRTTLGRPRWRGGSEHLPASWKPLEKAKEVFECQDRGV